jgi:hypothetical protein
MTRALTITRDVHFGRAKRGRKVIEEGVDKKVPDLGRIPRVTRLMALAIHMEDLIRQGEVTDYAELACLAHVTRARVTQIMNLLHLAPNIQEEILDMPRSTGGHDSVQEPMVRPIAAVPDWRKQRVTWRELVAPSPAFGRPLDKGIRAAGGKGPAILESGQRLSRSHEITDEAAIVGVPTAVAR